MICPVCGAPATVRRYLTSDSSCTEIHCADCSQRWRAESVLLPTDQSREDDASLGWRELCDTILDVICRSRPDAAREHDPLWLTAMSLRAVALTSITDHSTAQRQQITAWVLAGLLRVLRAAMEKGGRP